MREHLGCGLPPRLILEIDVGERLAVASWIIKQSVVSSTDDGGGGGHLLNFDLNQSAARAGFTQRSKVGPCRAVPKVAVRRARQPNAAA